MIGSAWGGGEAPHGQRSRRRDRSKRTQRNERLIDDGMGSALRRKAATADSVLPNAGGLL